MGSNRTVVLTGAKGSNRVTLTGEFYKLINIAPLYQNQFGAVVKLLFLVIYADFRGTIIAKISEA